MTYDPAILAATKTLHLLNVLDGGTGLDPWSDEEPCESCVVAVTPLIEAARPLIEAEALDRVGKEAAFDGRAQVSAWLHGCAQGIRNGGWAEWLNETDHDDERPSFTDDGHLDARMESE